uniref:Uncharacterized protein n=1 Tax=Anguilla anguilla TaxID=7936 RepID=A0A0E9V4Z8_ANGAN
MFPLSSRFILGTSDLGGARGAGTANHRPALQGPVQEQPITDQIYKGQWRHSQSQTGTTGVN